MLSARNELIINPVLGKSGLKSVMIEKFILDRDPLIEIEPEDFSDDADSTILIRERVRGTTLEGAFKKVRGNIVKETGNTLTILPRCGKSTIISKWM